MHKNGQHMRAWSEVTVIYKSFSRSYRCSYGNYTWEPIPSSGAQTLNLLKNHYTITYFVALQNKKQYLKYIENKEPHYVMLIIIN